MAQIVPSILEDNSAAFHEKLLEVLKIPEVRRVQVDISDGKFTPRKTVAVSDLDVLNPAYFWEAHLMVENPQEYFLDAKIAGFNSAIFHFEAVSDKKNLAQLAAELKKLKLEAGLAINPETKVEDIFEYAPLFDQILLLEVHPGYQGQTMQSGAMEKLEKLKKHLKNVKIEIDGGVKLDNGKAFAQAGADLLVVNSALYEAGETHDQTPTQNFEKLSWEVQNL